jgi:hypothetical protein
MEYLLIKEKGGEKMKHGKKFYGCAWMVGSALLAVIITISWAAGVPRMTKEELNGMLGNPDVMIIDVRIGNDWNASEFIIKGAVRVDPGKVSEWIDRYPKDKTLVFYCA